MEVTGATAGPGRNTRYMMEGVGARVIRGPDWKWGKQVNKIFLIKFLAFDVNIAIQLLKAIFLLCFILLN